MNIDLQIRPDAAVQDQALEKLRRGAGGASPTEEATEAKKKELKKVARDFESLFINMMLKSMRQTVPEDKIAGGGKAEDTYRFLLDQEYAAAAAKRGGIGIASMIEKELFKRYQIPSGKVAATEKAVVERGKENELER